MCSQVSEFIIAETKLWKWLQVRLRCFDNSFEVKRPRRQSKVHKDTKLSDRFIKVREQKQSGSIIVSCVPSLLELVGNQRWWFILCTHLCPQSPDIKNCWWVGMHPEYLKHSWLIVFHIWKFRFVILLRILIRLPFKISNKVIDFFLCNHNTQTASKELTEKKNYAHTLLIYNKSLKCKCMWVLGMTLF